MPPEDFEALAKCAFNTIKRVMGVDVNYHFKSGGVFAIRGVFDDRAQEVDPDGERVVSSNVFSLGIKLADLPKQPDKGDKLFIKNVEYRVIDSLEDGVPDVSTVLILHKVVT